MAIIPFKEWIPDSPAYGNPGATTIINAVPGRNSYKPFRDLNAITSSLDDYPRGAITAKDDDLTVFNYAGDESKLYSLSSTTWSDVSKGGGYSTGSEEVWDFARWKNKVLATNFSDNPQQIAMGAANYSDLTTALRARCIAVVRDFVFFGNTFDGTDGNVPDRLRWSAVNDETDYTVSASTQSDFRNLKSGDQIRRILGGEFATVLCERSIFRASYVGSPTVFQIDEVLPGVGTLAHGAATQMAGVAYVLTERGFQAISGATGIAPIGEGRVDDYFFNDVDLSYIYRMSSVADPESGLIAWAYPGSGHMNGTPNRILFYHPGFNRWGLVEKEVELLWRSAGVGVTLDGLDALYGSIEDVPGSLDDSAWKGGTPKFGAFDTSYAHGSFSGDKLSAIAETRETEIHSGQKCQVNAFRPVVDGGSVTGQIGFRDNQTDTVQYGSVLNLSSTGRFTERRNARYHRFRLNVSGDWNDIIGVQVEPTEARRAGRRG